MDRRLLKLSLHFADVTRDLEGALSDIGSFEEMMSRMNAAHAGGSQNDVLDFVEPITRWYSRDMLMTIRRLADDDRRRHVHSLVRLLREIRSLNTRDINGVLFDPGKLDTDIRDVIGAAKQAEGIANTLIAHKAANGGYSVPVTYRQMHDAVRTMANIFTKYAGRFYENWEQTKPKEFH